MAITLSANHLATLNKQGQNKPTTVIEVTLDSGTVRWGTHADLANNVIPVLKSVSSLQNKLDTKKGYSTRGSLTIEIAGREYFQPLIQNEYLKNRVIKRMDGDVDIAYGDFAQTYSGKIFDWSRNGDVLTLILVDELEDASKTKLPAEVEGIETLDYRNTNIVDVMTNILLTQLGIAAGDVNSTV
ncbi:unnamed protein product, partial [marine sediment metagenome]